MAVIVCSPIEPFRNDVPPPRGGAVLAVSEHAERAIRGSRRDVAVFTLTGDHVPMLRDLIESSARDCDLKLAVAAIERHGGVAVRFV